MDPQHGDYGSLRPGGREVGGCMTVELLGTAHSFLYMVYVDNIIPRPLEARVIL